MDGVWFVVCFCFWIRQAISSGRTRFECPDGFYLSNIDSTFENGHRMYGFNCASALDQQVSKESCDVNTVVSTTSNDMYLSCNSSQQYIVGVSIIDFNEYQTWSLSCCESSSIKINLNRCSVTPFINEHQNSFHFVVGEKHLMTKWQSIYDEAKNDRRWWIQTCPFEIDLKAKSLQISTSLELLQTRNLSDSKHGVKKLDTPERKEKPINYLKSKDPFAKAYSPVLQSFSSATAKIQTNTEENSYDDYYDPNGSMRRQKMVEKNGDPMMNDIFKNLHTIFKTIQDGLVFFQYALQQDSNHQTQSLSKPSETSIVQVPKAFDDRKIQK